MIRNIVQDVLPAKKTIRRVPIPDGRRDETAEARSTYAPPKEPIIHFDGGRQRKLPRLFLWIIVAVSVVVLIMAFSGSFSNTTLKVTPKILKIALDINLKASVKGDNADISYSALPISSDSQETVKSDGEKKAEVKASGTIIIYNNYSAAPQRLIKNTRFQTSNGLIYRLKDSIVVPGKKIVSGKVLPGSIEIAVYADGPGDSYNIGLVDFTIPGFKSSADRYAKFFARSKTPMVGGFSGTIKAVSDEKATEARARLDAKLKKQVLDQARSEIPPGFILYDGGYSFEFQSLPNTDLNNGTVGINERAVFTGFLIERKQLIKILATKVIPSYGGSAVDVPNLSELVFTLRNKDIFPTAENQVLSFNIKGMASFIWLVDGQKLKKDLAGKTRKEAPDILSKYESVSKTDIVIRPFWNKSFPENPEKITVKVLSGQ